MKICHKKQDGDAVCISQKQVQMIDQLIDIMFGRLINTSWSSRAFRTTLHKENLRKSQEMFDFKILKCQICAQMQIHTKEASVSRLPLV